MSDSGLPVPVHPDDPRVEVVARALFGTHVDDDSHLYSVYIGDRVASSVARTVLAALDELRASPAVHAARVEAGADALCRVVQPGARKPKNMPRDEWIYTEQASAALAAADAAERGETT